MSAPAASATNAPVRPELFPGQLVGTTSRALVLSALSVFVLVGFGLRAYQLGAESLSEDELNKVRAVAEYRERGLTPANGEHPFLMKALMAVSIVASEGWNSTSVARQNPRLRLSTETAARLPGVLLGALTSVLIFLVTRELFGAEVALLAAALWAFGPAAVGFNRIAKEDSFLVFFFLLANVFWLRGQKVAEEGLRKPEPYYWATAAAFGAMMASKYVPHFLAISGAYYWAFQGVKATRWRMGKKKWLVWFAVLGVAFVICNPTILLPGTWQEMRTFAGEKRIGHDAYEFLGHLYRNQMTLWLRGSPWYFYYVFMGVKLPVLVLVGCAAGLPLLFRRRLGDGRYFLLFWLFFWFFPFTFLGGKFTRYFTFALPAVLMTSAVGLNYLGGLLGRLWAGRPRGEAFGAYARAGLAVVVAALSLYASASAAPHYRLYTNFIGGGESRAGSYFPHDEFYDSSTRDIADAVAALAPPNARVASETPELLTHYLRLAGREDLRSVSLSDRGALSEFRPGDVVVVARGRRYFSNDELTARLEAASKPAADISLGRVPSARVYALDAATYGVFDEVVNKGQYRPR
ncbi:MAG TPA: glycosyltransferase family 39 protein [Pyrinomonadaceae bacterium]|nr:glycosyltransferase family 39 protein [Pyrinomonadaceae bacterium]